MSQWTHPQCERCWVDVNGPDRTPVRIKGAQLEQCCWCGKTTVAGIYVREDPKALLHHIDHWDD